MSTTNYSDVRCRTLACVGFPEYMIRSDGIVLGQKRRGKRKALRPRQSVSSGYSVCLHGVNGSQKMFRVSRLVLTAFVGPCPEGMQACHFPDPDYTNNRLENLRWDTQSGNEQDKIVHGTYDACHGFGEQNPCAKLTDEIVRTMKTLRRQNRYSYERIGKMFKVGAMTAWNAINGKTGYCRS